MSAPPGAAPERHGIPGTRTKAATNRARVGRIKRMAARADYEVTPGQVRQLLAEFRDQDDLSDQTLIEALMKAPWFPKTHHRQWRVGEHGWRVRS